MRKWEDIVKDKLEGYESALPEGSLAGFRALREGQAAPAAGKVSPWIWGAAAAIAAGLAAILFLRQPTAPENVIQISPQPSAPVAVVPDSADVSGPTEATPLVAQAIPPKSVRQAPARQEEGVTDLPDKVVADLQEEVTIPPDEEAPALPEEVSAAPEETVPEVPEPVDNKTIDFPLSTSAKTVKMKVGPAAGAVAGGGLLAAVIGPVLGAGTTASDATHLDLPYLSTSPGTLDYTNWPSSDTDGLTNDQLIGNPVHYFPLKVGVSARMPVAERLYVSAGLEYSLYQSAFTYSSGTRKQSAHYLGVPVRLDWVFASGRFLDVYVGGGLEGDVCVGAVFAGESIPKDGFSLSLLGAGGIQLNVTKRLGIYVEPELSWRIPVSTYPLATYRTRYPLTFSVAAGVRITFGQ